MDDQPALEGMKRSELQRLAKNVGIKANMKTDAIIRALKKFYGQSDCASATEGTSCIEDSKTEEGSATSSMETAGSSANEESCEASPPAKAVRRGRKGKKKTGKKASKAAKKSVTPEAATVAESSETETVPTPEEPLARRKTRSVTPKTLTGRLAPAVAVGPSPAGEPLRRKTRSVTPKTRSNGGESAPVLPVVPSPAVVPPRRKTRSVTPRAGANLPTATAAPVGARCCQPAAPTAAKRGQKTAVVQSDPDTKKAILAELEQRATEKLALQSRIPKAKTIVAKVNKPVTPGNKDWSRIHQANFSKMESIGDYVARKRKRTETMSASVKRAKVIADEARAAVQNMTSHHTPQGSVPKIGKPVSRVQNSRLSFGSPKPVLAKAPALKTKGGDKTAAAGGNKSVSFKTSRLKTPVRATALLAGAAGTRPARRSTPAPRRSVSAVQTSARKPALDLSARRKSRGETVERKSVGGPVTPYKFGLNPSTPGPEASGKPAFDLKASLSKPLAYKPHTGKLKPLEVSSRFQATSNIQRAKMAASKRPALKTREDRRAGANKHRANQRANDVMARRGLSAF